MAVNLSVVGIFYNSSVNTSALTTPNYSVQQIMDLAAGQPIENQGNGIISALKYSPGSDANYIDFIAATYSADPNWPGPAPQGITSISGRLYPFGTYALTQTATSAAANSNSSSYSVWQYYIFDPNQTIVPPGSRAEVPFTQTNVVQDGYSIVWRLVTISSQPTQANPRVARLFGAPTLPKVI